MANSKKKCKGCKDFGLVADGMPTKFGFFHNLECMKIEIDRINERKRKKAKKDFNKETRRMKESIKTKGEHTADAQKEFNRWIRLRDIKLYADQGLSVVCISCQKWPKKMNAGHYKSAGGNPELRFEPLNCSLQCEYCNTSLSANLTNYRINLIEKIGLDKVEWLEGPHEPKKYTIDEIKEIKAKYRKLANELEKELS